MRILVYGAGVLGCSLAHNLQKPGNEVVLFARGEWKEQIDNYGLFISHFGHKKPSIDVMATTDQLKSEDKYHVIFVTLQYTQLPSIMETLGNNVSRMIVFLGNNPNPEKTAKELKKYCVNRKQIVFGFESVAGQRVENKVETMHLGKGALRVGVIDEGRSMWEERLRTILHGTGVRLTVTEDMSAWLRYHAAFILPLAYACYCKNGDMKAVYQDKELMNDMQLAIEESYHAIENIGFEMDEKDSKFIDDHSWKTDLYYRMLMCTPLGKLGIANHSMNGRSEILVVAEEMEEYYNRKDSSMAHYRRLKDKAVLQLKKMELL